MFSMSSAAFPIITADTSRRVSSRLWNRSKLVALCAVLAMLLCVAGSIASAQTAHFGGAQTTVNYVFGAGEPVGVAVDSSGNLFVAQANDGGGVYEISAVNGSIPSTPTVRLLGSGFAEPTAVAVDKNGNVYVADRGNEKVKEILAVGGSIPASPTIVTLASGFYPFGVAVDGGGNVYVADYYDSAVKEILAVNGSIPASPTILTLGSGMNNPWAVAVDGSGDVYVGATDDETVRQVFEIAAVNGSIPATPTVNTLGSGFCAPDGVAVDHSGNVYVADYCNSAVYEMLAVDGSIPGSPMIETLASNLSAPEGVAVDSNGNVYVGGIFTEIQRISPFGGNFGTANVGTRSQAISLLFTFDTAGTLGSMSVLTEGATGLDFANAGTGTCAANTAYTAGQTCTVNVTFNPKFAGTRNGAVVLSSSNGNAIAAAYLQGVGTGPQISFLPNAESTVASSGLFAPYGVAVDGSGNVYIDDVGGGLALKDTLTAGAYTQSPLLTSLTSSSTGIAVDGSGSVYLTNNSTGQILKETLTAAGAYSESILPTSGLVSPYGVAVDGSGNVYISDTAEDEVIKETLTAGVYAQSILPTSGLNTPGGVAVDGGGNVYIVDSGNGRIIKETLAAGVYSQTILPTSGLGYPVGVAVDGNGNVYIADNEMNLIFKETPSNGTYIQSVVATSALSGPQGVAVDGSGNIYITDEGNVRVLKEDFFDPPSLTFANTVVGATSADSPRTITVENTGNAELIFPTPSTGSNPSVAASFTLNSSGSSDCPLVKSGSSSPGMLAAGASCQLPISFVPWSTGAVSGYLALTDNNLNAAAPSYSVQNITLNGTGTQATPSFTLGASPSSVTVLQGALSTSGITVAGVSGFNGSVSLAASSLPSGVTASFSPNSTTGSSVLTVTASSAAAVGTYNVTITGTSGSLTAAATLVLTVGPLPSFTIGASPASLAEAQGGSVTSTITVTGLNGFTGSANLAASGLPTGVTASFSPNPATGASVLTLTANVSATPGTATVTISGTSGTLTATTSLVLTINTPPGFAQSNANFGSVNIGTTSPVQTLTYAFGNAVTLGSTAVLTQGATGLDFANAGTGTCAANTAYAAAQTCTVNVTFTPSYAGTRYGALVLNDASGNVIATGYLKGTGGGPQVNFLPASQSALGGGYYNPMGVAVDGSGDIYVADESNGEVKEILAVNGRIHASPTINILGSGFSFPRGVAVDGAGNVYVTDYGNNAVKEILAVNGSIPASPTIRTLGSGFSYPWGIAVDGNGNVYVTEPYSNTVEEMLAVDGSIPASPTTLTLGGGFNFPIGIAVDGNGNVYIGDTYNSAVKEIVAVNGSIPASPTIDTLSNKFYYPAGVAVDGTGNVYLSDFGNNTVKKILAVNGVIPESPSIVTLTSGVNAPYGIAVDSGFNVYVADTQNNRALELDFADPPSLTFASTAVGATSTDSPKTVTVENVGNAALSFPIPSSGNNPSITANFTLNTGAASACPLISSGSSAAGTLAPGAFCQLPISFVPTAAGSLSGSLVLTDNNLNAAAPTSQTIALSGTGTQVTPIITWGPPAAITYGTPLSATQLNATSTIAGTFTYSPGAGTVLGAGQQTLNVTFTPTDTTDYTATASVTLTVNQATPTVNWGPPAAITYGTALSATQLNATSTVAGTFNYSPAAGTMLGAGQQTLTTTFTPTDTADYTVATASVTLTVSKATPAITWGPPTAITYGTALSATQLNATSTVAGTFNYSPAAGTVLGAGQQTLTTTFTPTDTADYAVATASVTFTVSKATPAITWGPPIAITYGTALSATQLNATSTVAGAFTYSPAAGMVLNAGTQTLTVSFAPTDSTDYGKATATVGLTVNKAALAISWPAPAAISYGTPLSGTQLDATSTVSGTFAYSPAAVTVLAVGSQTLSVTFTPTNAANYTPSTATASVTLTVNKATPTITWVTPAAISYGTKLSGTQLDASSTVAGTFAYSPASGTVLGVGNNSLTATFTPTNTTDYTTATASVTLTVNKVTPAITWGAPKAIAYGTALSATQLDATATVAGTFAYSPAAGTVLSAGQQTLNVTFTPTNTADYATATAKVTLTVNPAPSFTLSASPASLTVVQGASGKTTITVSGKNGFTGGVTLAASGLPSGVTAAFGTNPATGTSVLTLTASSTAATGTATVTINGTSGSLTASTTVALTISCTPTTIVPYIYVNGAWSEESTVTVSSPSTVVDLGPQPSSGGAWNWSGPSGYASTSRQINSIPLTVGTDSYLATYTNAGGCKSTETFTITVK